MGYILTIDEAANAIRTDAEDQAMLDLLPGIDAYIKTATGRDWSADDPVHPTAKSAARILLALWYDNPAMLSNGQGALPAGLRATLTQLEALNGRYHTFEGLSGAGAISLPGAKEGDTVSAVTGLIGVTGNQAAAFETVISYDDQIQQVSNSNLEACYFRVLLTPLEDL